VFACFFIVFSRKAVCNGVIAKCYEAFLCEERLLKQSVYYFNQQAKIFYLCQDHFNIAYQMIRNEK